jgi:hypothetical protein
MIRKTALIVICVLVAAGIVSAQSKYKKSGPEPRSFYEECDDDDKDRPCLFDHPVPLPDNILDALRATEEARFLPGDLKNYDRDGFAHLFKAIVIHLGNPNELDYVVVGFPPMSGADNTWFWIVRSNPTNAKVIFFTNSNGFELLKTRNNGYPIIRSKWYSPAYCKTWIYQYDGRRYILAHQYEKENKP